MLQTAPDWASFTARFRNRATKAEGPVTVIVERADPFIAGHPPTVFVEVDNVAQRQRHAARAGQRHRN